MSDLATRHVDGVVLPGPGTWTVDSAHSHLEFSVRHMVVGKTRGRFGTWSGTITVAEEPAQSSVHVEIDASSIDTRDANRDAHLVSPDFLHVEKHPTLAFSSTSVRGNGEHWTVTGDLTVTGVTRPVELDLTLEGVVEKDPFGMARA